MLSPAAKRTTGLILIFLTAIIWIITSFISESLVSATGVGGAPKIPAFLLTWLATTLFTLYLPFIHIQQWAAGCWHRSKAKRPYTAISSSDGSAAHNTDKVSGSQSDAVAAHTASGGGGGTAAEQLVSERQAMHAALWSTPLWFVAQYAFNASLALTSVTSNTILASTSSLFTFGLSVMLLGERFTLRKLGCILACILGTALVTLSDVESAEAVYAPPPPPPTLVASLFPHSLVTEMVTPQQQQQQPWQQGPGAAAAAAAAMLSASQHAASIDVPRGPQGAQRTQHAEQEAHQQQQQEQRGHPLRLLQQQAQQQQVQQQQQAQQQRQQQGYPSRLLQQLDGMLPLVGPMQRAVGSRKTLLGALVRAVHGASSERGLAEPTAGTHQQEHQRHQEAIFTHRRLASDPQAAGQGHGSAAAAAGPSPAAQGGANTGPEGSGSGSGSDSGNGSGSNSGSGSGSGEATPSSSQTRQMFTAGANGKSPLLGDMLVVVSGALYGGYTVVMRLKMPGEEAGHQVAHFFGYVGLFTTVGLAPLVVLLLSMKVLDLSTIPRDVYWIILLEGLLDYVLSDYLWARAVMLVGPTVATLSLSVQIPLAGAVELLGGSPPPWTRNSSTIAMTLAGTACILFGFVGINLEGSKEAETGGSGGGAHVAETFGERGGGGQGVRHRVQGLFRSVVLSVAGLLGSRGVVHRVCAGDKDKDSGDEEGLMETMRRVHESSP